MARLLQLYAKRLKNIDKAYNRKNNPIDREQVKQEIKSVITELNLWINKY